MMIFLAVLALGFTSGHQPRRFLVVPGAVAEELRPFTARTSSYDGVQGKALWKAEVEGKKQQNRDRQ